MKKIALALTAVMCFACISNAYAARDLGAGRFRSDWSATKMGHNGRHMIGDSDLCLGETAGCEMTRYNGPSNSGSFGYILMVARTITKNGGYFCPTFVEGRSDGATIYYDVGGTCHWLCKAGYSGTDCATFTSGPTGDACDANPVRPEQYATLTVPAQGSTNIEDNIPMFYWNEWWGGQEHDMILMISGFTPTGHGAFARALIVEVKKSYGSGSLVVWRPDGSKDYLLCKKGYKPNSGNTDCEIIDRTKCTESEDDMLANLCNGFKKDGYSSEQHVLSMEDKCYVYKCRETGTAFTSASDTTCIKCAEGARGGPSPDNGVCISCPTGKIFDTESKSTGYCAETIAVSKIDMMYGRGQTKNTVTKLTDQCWTKTEPSEYKKCITAPPKAK